VRAGTSRHARLAAIALLALAACSSEGKLVGSPAPDFSAPTIAGDTIRLANLRGRVVFLNLWATWCPPCREEMPAMQELYRQLAGPGFEMLAVSADEAGAAVVTPFVRDLGLSFPVLLDPQLEVASRYRVTGYPETYVIDRNGMVVAHMIGPRDWGSRATVEAFRRLVERGEWIGL
jgi:peroxiredoxin